VSDDHLIQAVWGDDPPRTATSSLQSHISRLRNLLGHDAVQRHDHSYILDFDPGRVDACEFEKAYREAAAIADSDPEEAVEACRTALQLWRGPPFGELCDAEFARPEAVRLEELRIDAMELFLESTIAAGQPSLVVPALRAAVTDHPYREKLWYLLMRALAVEGRRVEALRSFQEARIVLGAAGLEPTIDLRQLEAQIHEEDAEVRPHLTA
jgi:DNA-binding SARP family transcriptional activator